MNNNIYCVIEIIDTYTEKVLSVQVQYKSFYTRYFYVDNVPEHIKEFIKNSKNVKKYDVKSTENYPFFWHITKYYY